MARLTVHIDLSLICIIISCLILMMGIGMTTASPLRSSGLSSANSLSASGSSTHRRIDTLMGLLERFLSEPSYDDVAAQRVQWLVDTAGPDGGSAERVADQDELFSSRARRTMYSSGKIRIPKNGWERSGWGGGYGR